MGPSLPGEPGRRRIVFFAIALVSALIGFILYRGAYPLVQQVDLRLKDARMALRGAEHPAAPVVIVAIDNRSIKELGRWPWPRDLTARLIGAAARQGARVVALDMVFSEPQGESPDQALGRAVSNAGNVVMGYFYRDEPQPDDPLALEQLAKSKIGLIHAASGAGAVPVPSSEQVDANIPVTGTGAAGFGYFNQLADDDGLYRSIPLVMLFRGDLYPSLGLAALSRFLGAPVQAGVEQYGVSSVSIGSLNIPADEHGRLPLAYYGPGGTFPTVPAADVIKGRLPAGALKDRLVFIGVTETGLADLRATPLDPVFPGVEIHATFAANALEHRFLTRDARTAGIEMGAMLLFPLLLALLLAAVPGTAWALAGFALIASGYVLATFHLFSAQRLDLSIAYPLLPVIFTYLGGESYRNLVVERKGRHLKKAFSTYLSPDLVAEIVKNPERLKLGGEKRVISVLFSDIRGFTTLSEKLTPEELVALLNQYLSPMTRIVMEERGTLDKFIGDAVMALFNAPLEVPDHPVRACRSALRMVEELESLNKRFGEQGMPAVEIGIGIHTGEAVVGNMGADIRFDYTAIGDTVNLSSRLEGLNKYYGTSILVSGSVREQAGNDLHFRELDLVRVKGKAQPVSVYELRTAGYPPAADFSAALALYRLRNFSDSQVIFSRLASTSGDPVARMYVERCAQYGADPPPPDWDGVYVAKEK